MDESLNKNDQKRLMVFTSLIRLTNIVGHARVTQMHKFFVEYIGMYPSYDDRPFDFILDHAKMKAFLKVKFPIAGKKL